MHKTLLLCLLVIGCAAPENEFVVAGRSCQQELAKAQKGEPSWRTLFGAPRYEPGYVALTADRRIDVNTLSPEQLERQMARCSQATVLANRAQAREDAADMRMIARQHGFPVPYRISGSGRIY